MTQFFFKPTFFCPNFFLPNIFWFLALLDLKFAYLSLTTKFTKFQMNIYQTWLNLSLQFNCLGLEWAPACIPLHVLQCCLLWQLFCQVGGKTIANLIISLNGHGSCHFNQILTAILTKSENHWKIWIQSTFCWYHWDHCDYDYHQLQLQRHHQN